MPGPILPKGVKRQLGALNALTQGPAALRIGTRVQAIKLQFLSKVGPTSYGAKQFWRKSLPPIQFYNPELPISVEKYAEGAGSPSLIIDFEDGTSQTLPISGKTNEQILETLIGTTEAEVVPESEQAFLEAKQPGLP